LSTTRNTGWQRILGVFVVVIALMGLRRTLGSIPYIDLSGVLPSDGTILMVGSAVASLIFFYYYWYSQFNRVRDGVLCFAVCFGIGFVCYAIPHTFLHLTELTSFSAIWQFLSSKGSHPVEVITYAIWFLLSVAGFFAGCGIMLGFTSLPKRFTGGVFHQRGRRLISYEDAAAIAERAQEENDPGIVWGMLRLPSKISTTHFAVVGSTGSGKTITIRLLMQSVLPRIGTGVDTRAIIYDAKQDTVSMLAGMNLACDVVILNPFDTRGVSWNMADDITAPATAQQIAAILIPENKNATQPFFSDAARHLLSGVLISFIRQAPKRWTFRDVLIALKSKDRLMKVLAATPETADLIEQYLTEETTARNVLSTVASKMQKYEFIAASWERATRSISLREWLETESILILGNDEATRTALDAINQVIFKRLSELVLAQSESETRRTWIFLDELRQAGRLDGLSALLTKGRSKGASLVLGYQDIEGLRDVYGHQLANEIAGQCANKAILRCDSAETARWASALFGEREVLERRESTT